MTKKSTSLAMILLLSCLLAISGCGGTTKQDQTTPTPTPPIAPAAITVTPADKQLTVEWPMVYGATGYEVYYSTTNDPKTATKVTQSFTGTTCIITGLTNNTTYYVWVVAVNSAGKSDYSSVGTGKPISPINPPVAPFIPTLTARNKEIVVNWVAVASATNYDLAYGTSNDPNTATVISDLTNTTYTITGLINSTTYYVWVRAKNSEGVSGYSPVATAIPQEAKVNLTVTVVDSATNQSVNDAVVTIPGLSSAYSSGGTTYFTDVTAENDYVTTVTSSKFATTQKTIHVNSTDTQVTISVTLYSGSITGLVNSPSSFSIILVEQNKILNYGSSSYFNIDTLAPGTYHLKFERSGYAGIIKEVSINSNNVDLGSLSFTTVSPKGEGHRSNVEYWYGPSNGHGGPRTYFTIQYGQTITVESYLPVHLDGGFIYSNAGVSYYYRCVERGGTGKYSIGYWSEQVFAPADSYYMNTNSYDSSSYMRVTHVSDLEAPKISLSKTWFNSNIGEQISVNVTDSVSGVQSVYYTIANNFTTTYPSSSMNSIPASTAIQFTNKGVWYLHVRATDTAGNVNYLIEGPYLIQ
ncbi:MAG: fibronectin type III domain-containing protein [Bacteroidota bacterium]